MLGSLRTAFSRYPVKVEVWAKRANSIELIDDKAARIIEKDGTQYYHLKKHKLKIKPPEYKYIFMKKGKPCMKLFSPQHGQMLPINFENPPNLTIEDKETIFWGIQQIKKTNEMYPKERSIWEKYSAYILLGLTAALCFMIMIFAMPHLSATASALGSVAGQLENVAQMLTGYTPPPPGT